MARAYSAEYKSTLARLDAPEAPIILLEINHPALPTPVRIVNDMSDLTSNGYLFIALPFRCSLPDDYENKIPRASISIDNVGKELVQIIETSDGLSGCTVRFMQVMRSRPNQVEWEITMTMFNTQVNSREVTAELGFENLFSKPAISFQYRPENSIGIF